ncbi:MAG TPA: efflux RND transporter permease subunit [Clostridia bacterium]|nr:efflux RND transporter permease subunit [Clostridia bacterium]
MNITELSVKRPTAIIILVALFIGLGVMGYMSIGADLFPSANTPIMAIQTTYAGASAEEIEKDIVKPIEDAVSGISGIDSIHSTAGEGYGYSVLQFSMSTDPNTAVIDVQKAVDGAIDKLPEDASRPVIHKYNINDSPILILSVSGSQAYEELYKEADRIKQAVEKLPGVGNVTLRGAYKKELSIKLDKTVLEYYGIDVSTVISKLKAENLNIPAGQIQQAARNKTVRLLGEFENINEIKDLRIPLSTGGNVRMDDISDIELQYPAAEDIVRLNSKPSIGILIRKQSDANIVATANKVKNELEALKGTLSPGTDLVIAEDSTYFINSSLGETKRNLVEGIITTAIVLYLFLRSWRSSLIVLIAIPTSLISTFFAMYVLNFTFNIVSLTALALCVGILVDDSIVVLENIHRHMNMGKDHITAAIDGRAEISLAAIAITLCDVVVFAPIAFMTDLVGQFFRQFGLTVVFATLFSLFISFTLTPLMASRIYKKSGGIGKPDEEHSENQGKLSKLFDKYAKPAYSSFLVWCLDNRWKIVSIVMAGVVFSAALIPLGVIDAEFLPKFDQSKLNVSLSLTPGSSLEKTNEKTKQVEEHLKSMPEVKEFFTTVGAESNEAAAEININLVDKNKRKKNVSQLAKELRGWGKSITGISFSVSEPSIVGQTSVAGAKPVILNITGTDTEILKGVSREVEDIVRSVSGAVDIDNSIRASQPEIKVKIDRLAASEYGISIAGLASTLRTAIAGTEAGVFRQNGDEYDIIVSFNKDQVRTPGDIGAIKVISPAGQPISLSQIAEIYQSDSPQEVLRLDRQKVVTISANLQGRALSDANGEITEKLKILKLPYGYQIKLSGDQENMTDSFSSFIKALVASILLIYMILVVLYESYLTPLIRMLSLPCGIIGALLALAITGKTLNLISLIGIIMLDGLASKNGTLLIDYANTLMKRGLPLREALLESGITRLRPIIMTSITMIMGMMPLALALGEGSEIKSGMAVALIGGLITSTLLSPVLLPVVYTLMDDWKNHIHRKRSKNTNINGGATNETV